MHNKINGLESNNAKTARQPYGKPALKVYGDVRVLTAGGSGPQQETSSANGMGCGAALMKFC